MATTVYDRCITSLAYIRYIRMVCENVGREFCKRPAWYRMWMEMTLEEPQGERELQRQFYYPVVVIATESQNSFAWFAIQLACFIMFVLCLWAIKGIFKEVCSKCGGRIICQGQRFLEQLHVKLNGMEQRLLVLEEVLHSDRQVKPAELKQEPDSEGKDCQQPSGASLANPKIKETMKRKRKDNQI